MGRICPGVEVLLDVCAAETELRESLLDPVARKAAREVLISCVARAIDEGFGMGTKADVPARVKAKEAAPTECLVEYMHDHESRELKAGQEAVFRKGLKAVTECVACDVLRGDVIGYVGEDTHYGRPLVYLIDRPLKFGINLGPKTWIRKVTLHNGILNETSLRDRPTLAWMVLDVMSDLKRFTEEQVIDQVVDCYWSERDRSKYTSKKIFRRDLGRAYWVMRTHHWNMIKRNVGMGYMVVGVPSHLAEVGVQEIRGRLAHETYEYFQEHLKKMEASKAGKAPLVSLD